MKKGLLFVLTFSLLLTFCLGLAACGEPAQTKQYTVTFESNGGSAVNAVTVDKGGSVNLPDTSKTGYTFEGWFESEDFSGSKLSTPYTPSGNVTLYAKWKQGGGVTPDGMKYVITFVSNGGSPVESMTVASGAALNLPVPSREGYRFTAWCTDVQCENAFTQAQMPLYDFTLYAKWESIESGVESKYLYAKGFTEFTDPAVDLLFPKFDGKKIKRKIVSEDVGVIGETKYDLNTNFTPKEDYQIKWYMSADFKELIGSQRSELNYADNFFFVTINDKNGRVLESRLVNIYVLQDFQYSFYDTSSRYHESYQTEPVQTVRVIEGDYLTPITIESDYTFSKWTDETGAEFNFGVKPSKSAKLFARYESVTCSVDLNGGAGVESVIYAPFEKVELEGFYDKANMVFDGLTANGVHLTDEQGFALKDAKTVSSKAVRKLTAKWSEYTQEKYFSFKQVLDSRNNLIGYRVALSVSPASHKLYIPNEYQSLPVIDIADYGFSGSKFSELRVPDSVTSIGRSAFSGCVGLTRVTIGDSVTSIGDFAFSGCVGLTRVTIGDNVTSIGDSAFKGCSGITTVTIPDSVTSIGDSAFSDCIALTSVTIGDFVTSIGDSAFRGCSGLTSAVIPDSVTSIGDSAFAGCYGLTSMTLPFVGATKYSTRYAHLGYLFGASIFNYNSQYVPFALRTVIITGGNTIGEYAFYGCGRLTSVTIPNTVTTIYNSPFAGCYGLTNITLPFIGQTKDGTSKAYVGYLFGASSSDNNSQYVPSTLKTVIITGGDIIGSSAFKGCSGLTSVIMPDGVTTIGDSAFSGCSGLTSVTIPDGVTTIGDSAFSGCSGLTSVTIPDGVTTIGDSTFSGCSGLTSATVPSSVTSIGDSAFSDCSGLTSVTVPSSVTSIDDSAFSGCSGLTAVYYMGDMAGWCGISFGDYNANPLSYGHNLYIQNELVTEAVIPSSVTSINWGAFIGCTGLVSVTIPTSVTSIGSSAFSDCSGLTAVYYTGDMAGWCGISFGGNNANPLSYGHNLYIQNELVTKAVIPSSVTSINWGAFIGCTGLASVTIPDSVTTIGGFAFSGCTGLVSVTIPDSVTAIGSAVFSGCTGLTSVTIPDSVTSIGDSAFSGCSGLTSVTIPDSVSSINYSAFRGCNALTSVTIPSSVTSIGSNVFENCSNLKNIWCEAASRSVDWESNWKYNCPATVHWGYNNITTNAEYNYVIKNNQIYLTKYKGSGGKVEVPAVIDGLKVVSINAVFAHNDTITSVIIPNSVTLINEYAFSFCHWLTSVVIPGSVTSIRARAFYGCDRMKSVTIPSSVTTIGSSAFAGCSILDNIWCEATSRPSGWFITWKDFCPATVRWGGTWEYVNGVPTPKAA